MRPGRVRAAAHLFGLSGIALAQPLFHLLGDNPQFFAAHGADAAGMVVFALLLVVVPPAAMVAVEALLALVSRRAASILHLALVAALVALIALQALRDVAPSAPAVSVALSAAAGVAAAAAYRRGRVLRELATVLALAPVAFAVVFLALSPARDLVLGGTAAARAAAVRSDVPVVMVVLDELPGTALLDRRGRIDARRYPNFAALAADSHWFAHVSSASDDTATAVPAILTGLRGRSGLLPTLQDHPDNIFTLLAGRYRMHVSQAVTNMCPASACGQQYGGFASRAGRMIVDSSVVYAHLLLPAEIERGLPSISEGWNDFLAGSPASQRPSSHRPGPRGVLSELGHGERPVRFLQWVRGITASPEPTLDLIHTLLPHVPYLYLPSGRQYQRGGSEPIAGLNAEPGFDSTFATEHSWQRLLLQVGFVDRLLGVLIRRLKQQGIYDKALVVVVADHGIAFDPGHPRRAVSAANAGQSVAPPLFVKLPHERTGHVVRRHVQTLDVLPTIASVLGIRMPYAPDGRSLLDRRDDPSTVTVLQRGDRGLLRMPYARFRAEQAAALRRQVALFGDGSWSRALRFGPHAGLIGRRVGRVPASAPVAGLRVRVFDDDPYRSVDPASGFVPVHVEGQVNGGAPGAARDIAVAVNGRIAAVGRTFHLATGPAEYLAAMLPESALRRGRNHVRVFEVIAAGGHTALAPLREAG